MLVRKNHLKANTEEGGNYEPQSESSTEKFPLYHNFFPMGGGGGVGSPNNFSFKGVQFSLWFVYNYTPQHCGVEEVLGGLHLITNC